MKEFLVRSVSWTDTSAQEWNMSWFNVQLERLDAWRTRLADRYRYEGSHRRVIA